MSKKNFYIRESEMDDFQRKVVNRRSENSLIVRGCAGSGKSVIAFWRLHDIVSNNKGTVQIVVYTKSLKDYFVEGCRGEGIDPRLIDYWYHWRQNPYPTDYILVDEAQDFSERDIAMFRSYAQKALLLYGDSSQQIYAFRKGPDAPANMEEIQRFTQFPTEQLVFNHRLPAQIARVAEFVNAENDDLASRCKDEGDEKPYFLSFGSREEQLNAIIKIVRSRGLDDVGILLPKNDQARAAAQYLNSNGLNVEAKYNEGQSSHNTLNFATTNPKIMTYHSAKGLQFRAVFLPECENPALAGFLEPFYVAMTRSYQSLYILYTGQMPAVLQRIPRDLYETDIRARETEVL